MIGDTKNKMWKEVDNQAATEAFAYQNANTPTGINNNTRTFGKYGTKHGIHHFVTGIPLDTYYLINAALSFRTWQNKFSGYNSYSKFCSESHIHNSFPMSLENTLRYLKWLDQERKVSQDTAKVYISHLRTFHHLQGLESLALDDIRVKMSIKGIGHMREFEGIPAPTRRVVTYPLLQILGDTIFKKEISKLSKLNFWTSYLFGFFGSCRGGELVITGNSEQEALQGLRWQDILMSDDGHISIHIKHPKIRKNKTGDVIDLFENPDRRYCPIYFVEQLLYENMNCRNVNQSDLVFRKLDNSPILLQDLNRCLMDILGTKFPGHKFSMHSLRAGITCHMSHHPDRFTSEEEMSAGRWNTPEGMEVYRRNKGITRQKAMKKVIDMLIER